MSTSANLGSPVVLSTFRTVKSIDLLGIGFAIAILLLGSTVPLTDAFEPQLQRLFAVFGATVVLWITRPIPYSISSILCVILLFALDVTDTFGQAVTGFASTLVFFVILLLLLGKSIAKVDLDDWLANRLVSATSTPKGSTRRLSIAVFLLSLLMPSGTARTVAFIPIVNQMNDLYDLPDESRFRRSAYYLIGHVNVIGSAALMTGGGMSLVTAELVNALVRPITWLEWAMYMIPPVGVIFLLTTVLSAWVYQTSDELLPMGGHDTTPPASKSEPSRELDSLSADQWLVLTTLVVAVLLWVIGSFTGIPAILPAMFVVLVFTLPGIGVLNAADFNTISWGVVFLIGAMLSILDVMAELGGFEIIIDLFFSGIPVAVPSAGLVVILLGFSVVVRLVFSSVSAAILILLPVLVEFAAVTPVNELYLSFALLLMLVSASLLPFHVSPLLLTYEHGPLTVSEIFLLGVLTMLAVTVVIGGSWILYWPVIDGVVEGIF